MVPSSDPEADEVAERLDHAEQSSGAIAPQEVLINHHALEQVEPAGDERLPPRRGSGDPAAYSATVASTSDLPPGETFRTRGPIGCPVRPDPTSRM